MDRQIPRDCDAPDAAAALTRALSVPILVAWRTGSDEPLRAHSEGLATPVVDRILGSLDDPDSITPATTIELTGPNGAPWHLWASRGESGRVALAASPATLDHEVLAALSRCVLALVELGSRGAERERLRFILDNSADIIAVLCPDGTAEYVTPSIERVLGWPAQDFSLASTFTLVHPEDSDLVTSSLADALDDPGEHRAGRFRLRHRDGHWVWMEARAMIAPGRTDVAVVCARDVTQEVNAQEAASAEEARYRALVEASPQGIVIHQDQRLVYLNPAAARMLGATSAEELLGRPIASLSTASEDARLQRLRRVQAGEAVGPYESTLRRLDGSTIDLELTSIPTEWNGQEAVQVVAVDLTERRRAEALLEHSSLHDPLTGLPNRHLLADRIDRAVRRARRTGGRSALFFCDLDRFKVVNEALGHNVGDQVLIEVARRLTGLTREVDTVARFSGDEFVVLSEDLVDERSVESLAERIRSTFAVPIVVSGHTMHLTMSTGVVRISGTEETDELLSCGDSAMYAAKEAGRDRWTIFDERLRTRATDRLNIETALREALVAGTGLAVHLQPEVELASGAVVGYEALIRWAGPDGSALAPDRFLPVAAGAGLMPDLGRFVAGEVIGAIDAFAPALDVWVAMNASAEELEHPDFASHLVDALTLTAVDPARLCLEITEHSIMRDPVGLSAALRPLRERGVSIAIDDFGTGYSSLSYLARFQPEFVKIDRSFTVDIIDQPRQRSIVDAVLQLAESLSIVTVAEGVETDEQARLLTEMGCQVGQGWHFGRPAPIPAVVADNS